MYAEILFDKYKILEVFTKENENEKQVVKELIKELQKLKYNKDGFVIGVDKK